jgi:hypothetical protein
MEALDRFDVAIRMVERYEEYLYHRAMGLALIVNGIVGPSVFFLLMKAEKFSVILNLSSTTFSLVSVTLLCGIGVLLNIYLFASARILSSKVEKKEGGHDLPLMFLMFTIWFVSFFLVGYIPEPFSGVGWSLAGGVASLISYAVLAISGHAKRPELLIIGIVNILAILPVWIYGSILEVEILVLAVYALSFVIGGSYSTMMAGRFLEAE